MLAANKIGRTTDGEWRVSSRDIHNAATSESTAPAAITGGNDVGEKLVKNNASRAALPATWCAIIAADVNAAARVPSALVAIDGVVASATAAHAARDVVSARIAST